MDPRSGGGQSYWLSHVLSQPRSIPSLHGMISCDSCLQSVNFQQVSFGNSGSSASAQLRACLWTQGDLQIKRMNRRNTQNFAILTPSFERKLLCLSRKIAWLNSRGIKSHKCISMNSLILIHFSVAKRVSRPKYVPAQVFSRTLRCGSKNLRWHDLKTPQSTGGRGLISTAEEGLVWKRRPLKITTDFFEEGGLLTRSASFFELFCFSWEVWRFAANPWWRVECVSFTWKSVQDLGLLRSQRRSFSAREEWVTNSCNSVWKRVSWGSMVLKRIMQWRRRKCRLSHCMGWIRTELCVNVECVPFWEQQFERTLRQALVASASLVVNMLLWLSDSWVSNLRGWLSDMRVCVSVCHETALDRSDLFHVTVQANDT